MKLKFKVAWRKIKGFIRKFVRYGGVSLLWFANSCLVLALGSKLLIEYGYPDDAFLGVLDRWIALPSSDLEMISLAISHFFFAFFVLFIYEALQGLLNSLIDFVGFLCAKLRYK